MHFVCKTSLSHPMVAWQVDKDLKKSLHHLISMGICSSYTHVNYHNCPFFWRQSSFSNALSVLFGVKKPSSTPMRLVLFWIHDVFVPPAVNEIGLHPRQIAEQRKSQHYHRRKAVITGVILGYRTPARDDFNNLPAWSFTLLIPNHPWENDTKQDLARLAPASTGTRTRYLFRQ